MNVTLGPVARTPTLHPSVIVESVAVSSWLEAGLTIHSRKLLARVSGHKPEAQAKGRPSLAQRAGQSAAFVPASQPVLHAAWKL